MKNKFGLKFIVLGLLLLIITGLIFQECATPRNKEIVIGEIGKQYTIVLEENTIRNYECVKEEQFLLLKPEELIKLSEYMKKNDIVISPGRYNVNQIYNFDDLKRAFKI
jgi:hypothetical protein